MHACEKGHVDVAKLLLDHKADVDLQSLKWECALSLAMLRGHTEIIALLEVASVQYTMVIVNST